MRFFDWLRSPLGGPEFHEWQVERQEEPYLQPALAELLAELNRQGSLRNLAAWPHVDMERILRSRAWGRRRVRELREMKGLAAHAAVFDASSYRVLFLIEVTAPGWERGKRAREKRLRRLAEAAGIPLARWPHDRIPLAENTRAFLDEWLEAAGGHAPPAAPLCPRCGGAMVRRIAHRNTPEERAFWGCTAYPECRGTRNVKSEG